LKPFPRKEFSEADMMQRLDELGLAPSGSLVVQKRETNRAVAAAG